MEQKLLGINSVQLKQTRAGGGREKLLSCLDAPVLSGHAYRLSGEEQKLPGVQSNNFVSNQSDTEQIQL